MSVSERLKGLFNQVLDIESDEIKPDSPLDQSIGIDSTEMVEICVAIKKEFALDIKNNDFKKNQSFNDIVKGLESRGVK